MRLIPYCCTLLLAASPAVHGEPPTPIAVGDHLVAIDADSLTFDADDLLANDQLGSQAEEPTVEVLEPPRFGSLDVVDDSFRYQPDPAPDAGGPSGPYTPYTVREPVLATDSLTYRAWVKGVPSEPVTVVLALLPEWLPIAGRWPTTECNPAGCSAGCDLGQGAEIGFYNPRTGGFSLCDLEGDNLKSCRYLPTPAEARGPYPLVFDLDGDGWDELGVLDPSRQLIHWLVESHDSCPAAPGSCLQVLGSEPWTGAGTVPLGGRWDGTQDRLGFFEPRLRGFDLGPIVGGFQHSFAFGEEAWHAQPLAGDWHAQGFDTVALYDRASRTLHARLGHTSGPVVVFGPIGIDGNLANAMPFAGRANRCGGEDFFGFYDSRMKKLSLFFALEGSLRGPLHVKIPADPGGGGGGGD